MSVIEKTIHEEACQVLEEVGIKCKNQKIIDIFESTGYAAYDSTTERIHILTPLVDESLKTTPKRNIWTPKIPERSFGSGGTAPYVYDEPTGKWIDPDVRVHVAEIAKIAEKYKIPFIFRGTGKAHCAYEDTEQIKVLREHYNGFIYIYVATEEGVVAVKEEWEKTQMTCTTHSILMSPLSINDVGPNYPVYFRCVEEGLPIYLVTMPINRINAPATIYGLTVQCHAEFLVGLCLTQTLNPGIITIHAGYPLASGMLDNYNTVFGHIEHNFANLSMARVATYLNLPAIQSGCTTNSKIPDKDTEKDVIRAYKFWNSADGWHQVRHCFGFLNYQLAFSIPKMERDCITLKRILKENEQMRIPELLYDSGAIGVIADCAPIGTFLNHDHTLKNIEFDEKEWGIYLK